MSPSSKSDMPDVSVGGAGGAGGGVPNAAAAANTANSSDEKQQALSVSAALALAKGKLEGIVVKIVGEVSEIFDKSGYRAVYFTVKDDASSLSCLMWSNRYRTQDFKLEIGQLVELTGRFTLYAPKGRMNFEVFSFSLAGEGDLRLKVARLAAKLEAEGLMNPQRKCPVPHFPESIGLVTSPHGAAVHDVLRTLRRRFPLARVCLAGVPVEGAAAAAGIIEAMRCVYKERVQVILIVRGGGSFEDLMPFNDEALARAISRCDIPVVTGIGHEVDTTIADMVSDLRASTPTAAAEAVSPSAEEFAAAMQSRKTALETYMRLMLQKEAVQLSSRANYPLFRDPASLFATSKLALDYAKDVLLRTLPSQIADKSSKLKERKERFVQDRRFVCEAHAHRLSCFAAHLNDLSPLSILARGYAVARSSAGIVRSVEQAPPGTKLSVMVADGHLSATVDEQTKESSESLLLSRNHHDHAE